MKIPPLFRWFRMTRYWVTEAQTRSALAPASRHERVGCPQLLRIRRLVLPCRLHLPIRPTHRLQLSRHPVHPSHAVPQTTIPVVIRLQLQPLTPILKCLSVVEKVLTANESDRCEENPLLTRSRASTTTAMSMMSAVRAELVPLGPARAETLERCASQRRSVGASQRIPRPSKVPKV